MSLLEGFLHDIIDHPDDDALADPGGLAHRPAHDLRSSERRLDPGAVPGASPFPSIMKHPALEAQEMLLLQGPAQHWATRYRGIVRDWTFHRGLIGEVRINAPSLVARAGQLFRFAPFKRSVTLLELENSTEKVAALPELARLRGLKIGPGPPWPWAGSEQQMAVSSQTLTALIDSPHLTGLRKLAINHHVLPVALESAGSIGLATTIGGARPAPRPTTASLRIAPPRPLAACTLCAWVT